MQKSKRKTTWVLFSGANVLNLLAISPWSFALALYPVAIGIIDGVITLLVVVRWRIKR